MKTLYRTVDGKLFESYSEGEEHEKAVRPLQIQKLSPDLYEKAQAVLSREPGDWDGCQRSEFEMFMEVMSWLVDRADYFAKKDEENDDGADGDRPWSGR